MLSATVLRMLGILQETGGVLVLGMVEGYC